MSRQSLVPILLPRDPVDPMEAATKGYVDAHAGGGTGSDEVWVGPDAPTGATLELWVDTDAPALIPNTTMVESPGGTVAGGAGTTVVLSLALPVIPVGQKVLLLFNLTHGQAGTKASYDISFVTSPPTTPTILHQENANTSSSGKATSWSYLLTGTGIAITAQLRINPWGGQQVEYRAGSNIIARVLGA